MTANSAPCKPRYEAPPPVRVDEPLDAPCGGLQTESPVLRPNAALIASNRLTARRSTTMAGWASPARLSRLSIHALPHAHRQAGQRVARLEFGPERLGDRLGPADDLTASPLTRIWWASRAPPHCPHARKAVVRPVDISRSTARPAPPAAVWIELAEQVHQADALAVIVPQAGFPAQAGLSSTVWCPVSSARSRP
jgi:hypothetical protein